jgi:hypothetical protein
MKSTGNEDQRFEAIETDDRRLAVMKDVVRHAIQLTEALAEADKAGVDMVASYGELNVVGKRTKYVIATQIDAND